MELGGLGEDRGGRGEVLVRTEFAESLASVLHPNHNEDAFLLSIWEGAGGVFDGVGGLEGGSEASRIGREACAEMLPAMGELGLYWPEKTLQFAREKLLEARYEHRGSPEGYMNSTAVLACVVEDEVAVAWCGDSRAYGIRTDGSLLLLTTDHGNVDLMVRQGFLSAEFAERISTVVDEVESAEEALEKGGKQAENAFLGRNTIQSALSDGPITTRVIPALRLEGILLTSDGVHDNLRTEELGAVTSAALAEGWESVAMKVVEAARQYSEKGTERAKADDMTAVFLPISKGISGDRN